LLLFLVYLSSLAAMLSRTLRLPTPLLLLPLRRLLPSLLTLPFRTRLLLPPRVRLLPPRLLPLRVRLLTLLPNLEKHR